MKCLVSMFLLCAGILTVRSQQENGCINTQYELESSLLDKYDIDYRYDDPVPFEEATKAFVPDLFNASSFLVPRLVYVLFACNTSQCVEDAIDNELAFVWTNEYLFAYMHPAVIRLVSLFDVTSWLGPSVHTLRLCPGRICPNASSELNFEQAIFKVREHVFLQKAYSFTGGSDNVYKMDFLDTWKSYLYDETGYILNLHEVLPDFYIATYSLFMGVYFLALFIGMIVTLAFGLQIISKLVANERSTNVNAKESIPVFYRWSGGFSITICGHILLLSSCYLLTSFKELSSFIYPNLSYFGITCHIISYVFICILGFGCSCCLPQFLAKKYFKNKLNQLINRRSCGCGDRLVLGFALTLCTILFYHVLFGLIIFLHYPLIVICVLVSRLTYLTILGLCVYTSVRLYMTFGIYHVWIYCNVFIQIIIICLYYSVLYGVALMLGIGYTLESIVLLKYVIVTLFISAGVLIISYYVYTICCKPLFYSEKELLKVKRQKKKEDQCNETVINMSELSPVAVAGNNCSGVDVANPTSRTPDKLVYFAGGVLLINNNGNVTWIPVNQK